MSTFIRIRTGGLSETDLRVGGEIVSLFYRERRGGDMGRHNIVPRTEEDILKIYKMMIEWLAIGNPFVLEFSRSGKPFAIVGSSIRNIQIL